MIKKAIVYSLSFLALAVLLFSCNTVNPFDDPKNVSLSILLKGSSDKILTNTSITEQVGTPIQIGALVSVANLVDSVTITVKKYSNNTDLTFRFGKEDFVKDTLWHTFTFTKAGTWLFSATAYINNGDTRTVPGEITLTPKTATASINPSSIAATPDSMATFSVSVTSGDQPYSYQWYHDTTLLTNNTNVTIIIAKVAYSDTGKYTCLVSDKWGDTVRTAAAILSIKKVFAASISPTLDTVPTDTTVSFTVTAVGDTPFTYKWFLGTTEITGQTAATFIIAKVAFTDSGAYTCRVKNKNNDSVTTSAAVLYVVPRVIVNHKPVLSIIKGHTKILSTDICTLTVAAADTDIGQTFTYNILKKPAGSNFTGTTFIWAVPAGYLGTDTMKTDSVIFTVLDNGIPVKGDTLKVGIQVSKTIPLPSSVTKFVDTTRINGVFSFKWNKAANADGYQVFRSKDSATGFISVASITDTSFANTIKDTVFYYYVVATNSKGAASPSQKLHSSDVNSAPKWTSDTLKVEGFENDSVTKDLSTLITDVNGDKITYQLTSGNPLKNSLIFSTWKNVAALGDTGPSTIKIQASDGFATSVLTILLHNSKAKTFTITYDGNGNTGGNVPVDANPYTTGASVTVLGNTGILVKTGNTFAGWNAKADGSGTNYAANATFSMGTANVTLYAKWTTSPTYTVTYDANGSGGGSVPADAYAYLAGDSVTVLGNTGSLVKIGYTYAGWNTKADGSGTNYSANAKFAIGTTNVILYAKWTVLPTYSVTYNGNSFTGGTAPVDPVSYLSSSYVVVLGNSGNLTKTGYTWTGWNTSANGSGTSYLTGATFLMGPANVVLYAQWALANYGITYTLNGGTNPGTPATSYNVTSTAITLPTPTKAGYTFNGWFTDAGFSGSAVTSIPTGSTGNKSFFAKWTIITYNITYTLNGGTNGSNPVTYDVTTSTITLANPTFVGHAFNGWYTNSGFTSNALTSIPTGSTGDVALFAKWSIQTYQLNASSGLGGAVTVPSPSSLPLTVNYNIATTITAVANAGYKFDKWTVSTGTANIANANIASTTIALSSGNATVTASFKPLCRWTAVNSGLTNNYVWAIASNTPNIFAGTSNSGVFLSNNNGSSWGTINNANLTDMSIQSIGITSNYIFAGGGQGDVFASYNAGASWTAAPINLTTAPVTSFATSGNDVFAGTYDGGVFYAKDYNQTWSDFNNGLTQNAVWSLAISGTNLFAGTLGKIFVSPISSPNWVEHHTGLPSLAFIYALAVSGTNIFAAGFGGGDGGVYRSSDNGITWTPVSSGITTVSVKSLTVSGAYVLAGTDDSGVFISGDNGASWTPVNNGLPSGCSVNAFTICGSNIFAATNGNGIYISPLP